jgi:hypothetical protein
MSESTEFTTIKAASFVGLLAVAIMGIITGIFYLDLQWNYFAEPWTPSGFVLMMGIVIFITGFIVIGKGIFLKGYTLITMGIYALSSTLLIFSSDVTGAYIMVTIGLSSLLAIAAVMCFIGGDFNLLVINVLFAIAIILGLSVIQFEYKYGLMGILMIAGAAVVIFTVLMEWNAIQDKRYYSDDYNHDDDEPEDDYDDRSEDYDDDEEDDYDDYDSPRSRRKHGRH